MSESPEKSAKKKTSKARVVAVRPASDKDQVVTVEGGRATYRRKPCSDCPWRVSAVGEFSAESFRHSASTAYDMAQSTFACHQSGVKSPSLCAGFLLRGADHNMMVRLMRIQGRLKNDVTDGGVALHDSYRDMAIANGVDPDDPVLKPCR
jgi:hypothetical protein